jgi:ZIP family zinc transporter/zinc and cadmium transporter
MAASSLASLVTTVGVLVIATRREWTGEHSVYFKSFAAGMLISISFMHITPKSLQMSSAAPASLLVGFLAIYLSNRLLRVYVCHEHECTDYALGIVPALGIGFHSFVDGIIYSVTFNVSTLTGVLAAIGMVVHEFPEGIVTYALLQRGGFSQRRSLIYALLTAGLSTPLGTLISFPFITGVKQSGLGILLALSAGALIYVGASHLLPEVEKENRRYSILTLGAGVLFGVIIIFFGG